MHVTVLVGIQLFQVFPGHPAPLGRPEELSTQAQVQVGTGCCLVIPNHWGRDVCLGSTVWPRWGLPGQLSCPQIPPWGQGPRARRHGCERRRRRPGDGPVHRAALPHTPSQLCALKVRDRRQSKARAQAVVHVTLAWCPWRRALWGPGLILGRQSLPKSGVG